MRQPSPDPSLALGRTQARLSLGVIFLLSAAPVVARWVRGDVAQAGVQLAGFAVTAFVLWQVYRGSRVALFVTLAITVLGGLALMLLSPLAGISVQTLMLLLAGLAFAICGLALYAHAPIRAFLEAQRSRPGRA